jgi:hypothetical protein
MATRETAHDVRAAGSGGHGSRLDVVVLLAGWIGGSVVYAVAVTGLAHSPSVVRARGSGGAARPVEIGAVTLAAVVVIAVLLAGRRGGAWPAPGVVVALLLVGSGAAWVAWGLVDQHVLRTFDLAPGSVWSGAWDGLFHGVGVMAAGVGTSMLSAGARPGP